MRFMLGIILARLLFPEQFGLIAMLTIFMVVAQLFLDSGFGAALIQKRDATQADICSIFYFNILGGLAATLLLCLSAPWIASFFNQPMLTSLVRVLSINIVINSFGLIQTIIMKKELNFKALTKVSLIASITSGIIAVVLATSGFGVWSLVIQQVTSALISSTLLWFLSSWRPALIFSFNSLRELFSFGSRLFFSFLLNHIFENLYSLVIGKLFSPADLGFFARAKTLEELPSQTLSDMIGQVTFPVFSAIQDDPIRLKKGLRKVLTLLVLVNFPMMIGLAVIARPLVIVLLTEKWAECVPYLQLFCFVGLLYPLHLINLNVLQALGRSDLFLRLEIIKKGLIVISIAITWRWGISAMICGLIAVSIIAYYLNSYYNGILIGYTIREQLRDLSAYLITATVMGMILCVIRTFPFPNLWCMLLGEIVIGSFVYVGLCRICRLEAFMELWQAGWKRIDLLQARG